MKKLSSLIENNILKIKHITEPVFNQSFVSKTIITLFIEHLLCVWLFIKCRYKDELIKKPLRIPLGKQTKKKF